MSYGQPCSRKTAGPSAGPASTYPTSRTPAWICLTGPNGVTADSLFACVSATGLPFADRVCLTHSYLAQRSNGRTYLLAEELGLLPRGEVATPVDLVEVDDVRIRRLDPAARRAPDLARERREAERDRRRRQRFLAGSRRVWPVGLPVRPRGRRAGAGQPVGGDVVEDVVAGEVARRLVVNEGVRDLVVGVRVVVDHPRRECDGGVQQRVADGLGPSGLLHKVTVAARLERLDRGERRLFLLGVRRQRRRVVQRRHEQVRVDADQAR